MFYKSKKELDNLCGRDEIAHQGLIAEVEQLEDLTLKDFLKNNNKTNLNLIALDDVSDPRNIGAIIRTAPHNITADNPFQVEADILFRSMKIDIQDAEHYYP